MKPPARLAVAIGEIGRVWSGEQTIFLRPSASTFWQLQPGAKLWLAEPFHLEKDFAHLAPTAARDAGARPVFAADHLHDQPDLAKRCGPRLPARSLCREWHRAHVIVQNRTELRLQDLGRADIENLGFRTAVAFAEHWDREAGLVGLQRYRWRDNPLVLRFGFALVAEPLPKPDRTTPAEPPAKRGPKPRRTAAPPALLAPAPVRACPAVAEAAAAFADRDAQVRKLSATAENPVQLAPRPVRTVAAPLRLAATLPSLAERESGLCARCGSRLAYGCEHHPRIEEDAA